MVQTSQSTGIDQLQRLARRGLSAPCHISLLVLPLEHDQQAAIGASLCFTLYPDREPRGPSQGSVASRGK